jgi:hypothetical protein
MAGRDTAIDTLPGHRFVFPALIFLIGYAFRLYYRVNKGVVRTSDLSWYLSYCETLSTSPLEILTLGRNVLYSGFGLPFCAFLGLPGGSVESWVTFQVVISAATSVLIYATAKRSVNTLAGLIAGLTFAILFDTFRFIRSPLTETVFVFAIALALWALGRYVQDPSLRNRLVLYAAFGWVAITRPLGPAILLGWLVFDLYPAGSVRRFNFLPSRRVAVAVFLGGFVFLALAVDPSHLVKSWTRGWIYAAHRQPYALPLYPFQPTPTGSFWTFVVRNVHHIIALGFLRAIAFFNPALPFFWRNLYRLLSLLVMVPTILLTFVGTAKLYRRRFDLFRMWLPPLFVMVAVVSLTWFNRYGRYRAPAGPIFALVVGYVIATDHRVERLASWAVERTLQFTRNR